MTTCPTEFCMTSAAANARSRRRSSQRTTITPTRKPPPRGARARHDGGREPRHLAERLVSTRGECIPLRVRTAEVVGAPGVAQHHHASGEQTSESATHLVSKPRASIPQRGEAEANRTARETELEQKPPLVVVIRRRRASARGIFSTHVTRIVSPEGETTH